MHELDVKITRHMFWPARTGRTGVNFMLSAVHVFFQTGCSVATRTDKTYPLGKGACKAAAELAVPPSQQQHFVYHRRFRTISIISSLEQTVEASTYYRYLPKPKPPRKTTLGVHVCIYCPLGSYPFIVFNNVVARVRNRL